MRFLRWTWVGVLVVFASILAVTLYASIRGRQKEQAVIIERCNRLSAEFKGGQYDTESFFMAGLGIDSSSSLIIFPGNDDSVALGAFDPECVQMWTGFDWATAEERDAILHRAQGRNDLFVRVGRVIKDDDSFVSFLQLSFPPN